MKLDISGLEPGEVLVALFNNALVSGKVFPYADLGSYVEELELNVLKSNPLTTPEADTIIHANAGMVEYITKNDLPGRDIAFARIMIKVDFQSSLIDTSEYDKRYLDPTRSTLKSSKTIIAELFHIKSLPNPNDAWNLPVGLPQSGFFTRPAAAKTHSQISNENNKIQEIFRTITKMDSLTFSSMFMKFYFSVLSKPTEHQVNTCISALSKADIKCDFNKSERLTFIKVYDETLDTLLAKLITLHESLNVVDPHRGFN